MANKSTNKNMDIVWEQKDTADKTKKVCKVTMKHGDCISAGAVDLDTIAQEGTGLVWKDGDNKVHVSGKSVWNYNKNTLCNSMAFHYGGKAFGETAKAYLHSDFTGNFSQAMAFQNANVLNQWWIVDGDVSAGVRTQYDFTTK